MIPGPLGRSRHRRWLASLRRRVHPSAVLLGDALSRGFDLTLALGLLVLLSPLLLGRGWLSHRQTGKIFSGALRVGRFQMPFRQLSFAGHGRFRRLAVWLNLLKGEMALVGPRALTPEEASLIPTRDLPRFSVRPGLVSAFSVRSRTGIAHQSESAMDRELVYNQSLKNDLGLAARSVVAGALGGKTVQVAPPLLNFFGIPIVNTTMAEAVDWIMRQAASEAKQQLAFVNPDCLNIAWSHADYHRVLRDAQRVLPDGIGIHLGCRMLGQSLKANVNGTDLFPLLCEAAASNAVPLYLLGARPGIARATAEAMRKRFPALRIVGARDGYFTAEEEGAVVEDINRSGARILLVALGAPRQDLWISRWRDALAPPVCMGVGGLFDFYSGRIPRAPLWMRELGLEWSYRLMQEPGRMWRRYVIGNPLFLFRVWRQAAQPDAVREMADASPSRQRTSGRR